MTDDKSIFGQSFKSREDFQPSQEEITTFLGRTNKGGREEPRTGGLEAYRRLIEETEAFARGALKRDDRDLRQDMLYGVLGHARFANRALLSAVVLYRYHLYALSSVDFRSPSSFIKSAESEMARLNKKNIRDVMRMARLQEMIAERKKILEKLKKQWMEIASELRRIALYVRENLITLERLCETSIVVLAELEIGKQKEKQLIEDIKTYYKMKFKEELHRGRASRQDLENAKQELDLLTMEISVHVREDVDAVTGLYATIHEHVQKSLHRLDTLLVGIEDKKSMGVHERAELFQGIEQALISLLADCRIDVEPSRVPTNSVHRDVLRTKRLEMLAYLLEEVRKERRVRKDRRSLKDRRKNSNPNYAGPERRSGADRRGAKGRRSGS